MSTATTTTAAHRFYEEVVAPKDGIRPMLRGVFEVLHDGERWLVSTDAYVMVAERSDAPAVGEWTGQPNSIPDILWWSRNKLAADLGTYTTDALRAFAGEPEPKPEPVTCPKCDGAGEVDHWCDCEFCEESIAECGECDGSGRIGEEPAVRYGWIGAALFNRDQLATALRYLGRGKFNLFVVPMGASHMLYLVGKNRRAVVVGVRPDDADDAQDGAPHFGRSA